MVAMLEQSEGLLPEQTEQITQEYNETLNQTYDNLLHYEMLLVDQLEVRYSMGPSIKYVMLQGGRGLRKCDSL